MNTNDFIKRAIEVHGDKYDYSKVKYTKSATKVCIICPEHGDFWQLTYKHLEGKGCKKCGYEKNSKNQTFTTKEFIEKSNRIHNNFYIYDKTLYKNAHSKVCITCPEHGDFWQLTYKHLKGYGCNKCSESSLENKLRVLLESNDIKYEYQKMFHWLGRQSLDFYLPEYNIGIECQGEEHFRPIDFFGGLKAFKKISENDNKKLIKCRENKVKIIYFSEDKYTTFRGIKTYNNSDFLLELKEN